MFAQTEAYFAVTKDNQGICTQGCEAKPLTPHQTMCTASQLILCSKSVRQSAKDVPSSSQHTVFTSESGITSKHTSNAANAAGAAVDADVLVAADNDDDAAAAVITYMQRSNSPLVGTVFLPLSASAAQRRRGATEAPAEVVSSCKPVVRRPLLQQRQPVCSSHDEHLLPLTLQSVSAQNTRSSSHSCNGCDNHKHLKEQPAGYMSLSEGGGKLPKPLSHWEQFLDKVQTDQLANGSHRTPNWHCLLRDNVSARLPAELASSTTSGSITSNTSSAVGSSNPTTQGYAADYMDMTPALSVAATDNTSRKTGNGTCSTGSISLQTISTEAVSAAAASASTGQCSTAVTESSWVYHNAADGAQHILAVDLQLCRTITQEEISPQQPLQPQDCEGGHHQHSSSTGSSTG